MTVVDAEYREPICATRATAHQERERERAPVAESRDARGMLAVSHPISSALPSPHDRVMDDTGTIDPAALNSSGTLRRQYCCLRHAARLPPMPKTHIITIMACPALPTTTIKTPLGWKLTNGPYNSLDYSPESTLPTGPARHET